MNRADLKREQNPIKDEREVTTTSRFFTPLLVRLMTRNELTLSMALYIFARV